MNVQQKTIEAAASTSRLYIAPLDGLRFFAFLAVFVHHLPQFSGSTTLLTAHNYGWAGVELFFLISSFLFFHLLDAEFCKTGRIRIGHFFMRRFLRIYPLMILFPTGMLLWFGSPDQLGWLRLAALALFADNAVIWFKGYNTSIPNTAHLWTLSFEFQIYLIIPFVFLAYRRYGKTTFLAGLVAVFLYGILARMTVYGLGAKHPLVWVTPFFRPENVLAGMALYVLRPKWHWGLSAGVALLAGIAFLSLTPPWASASGAAFSYPLGALTFAGLVDAGLRMPGLSSALSSMPLRFLGKISFGLYVFHVVAIGYAVRCTTWMLGRAPDPVHDSSDYWTLWATSLGLTIAAATISYFAFEKWLAMLKARFSEVEGRPA